MSDLYDTDIVTWSERQAAFIAEELAGARREAAAAHADNREAPPGANDAIVYSEDQVLGDWLPTNVAT
jgi:hypothetical protein